MQIETKNKSEIQAMWSAYRSFGRLMNPRSARMILASFLLLAICGTVWFGFLLIFDHFDINFCTSNFCLDDLPTNAGHFANEASVKHFDALNIDVLTATKFVDKVHVDMKQSDFHSAINYTDMSISVDAKLDEQLHYLQFDADWASKQFTKLMMLTAKSEEIDRARKNLNEAKSRAELGHELVAETHRRIAQMLERMKGGAQ